MRFFPLYQDASGLLSAAETLSKPSEEFGNDSRVEALWAMKAMEHAEVYFNVRGVGAARRVEDDD